MNNQRKEQIQGIVSEYIRSGNAPDVYRITKQRSAKGNDVLLVAEYPDKGHMGRCLECWVFDLVSGELEKQESELERLRKKVTDKQIVKIIRERR